MQAAFGCQKGKATGSSEIGLWDPTVLQDMFFVVYNYLWGLDIFLKNGTRILELSDRGQGNFFLV
jgi:hypothetical protein